MKMMIELLMECPFCGREHTVTCDLDAYRAWEEGALVQDAFPDLSATEREQMISHICPECQSKVFG